MAITLRKLTTVEEMLPHWRLVVQLTPDLSPEAYGALLREMVPHNYFQVAAFEGEACIGLSGYWIGHKLYSGKCLEIDNFIVDEAHRGQGVGERLVDRMAEEARREGCRLLMLDAYVENFQAHRFYYRNGFHARGFHYLKRL
ncbi:MAG: GNAT family N-acetyltransferase [Bacteroidetes bacterium]|nr:GNAT family N-acetyltransferase [Bacteroidota bacterium]